MKTILLCVLFFVAIICSCSNEPQSPPQKTWEIQIPLNQTAVHANATYLELDNKMTLEHLVISSVLFSEQNVSHDTTYLNGSIEQYIPSEFEDSGTKTGTVKLSFTDNWVFMENISENLSNTFFSKKAADSTKFATKNFQHFPIYPRFIEENEFAEIIRPENSGEGWQLKSVYRKFDIGKAMTWDDHYGRQDGVFVKTLQHSFNNDSTFFSAMFDEKGVVISQSSLALIITDNVNPANNDTVYFHQINRRIRNYSDPLFVPELKTLADNIINKRLEFFIDN